MGFTKEKDSKELIIDEIKAEVVRRIFKLYLDGASVCSICKLFNEEEVLNRHWATTTVDKILSNQLYIGNMEFGKRTNGENQIFENVVPAIIDKTTFNMVQKRKEKNLKNFKRKLVYIFMQKIKCPKCGKIMGGSSSTSKNKTKHIYYKCASCNTRINENRIEKSLMKFLNDMLDFFLIVDNSFKPTLNLDTENEIKKYKTIINGLEEKENRIKKAFIDGLLEPTTLSSELKEIENELEITKVKVIELEKMKESMEFKQDIKTIFNKNEIENIGYMFRNDCFDMIVNVNERDIILSNYKNEQEKNDYVYNLRNFYNIKETTIQADLFDINSFNDDDVIQIIPQEKKSKFDKNIFTILQIEV